MHGNFSEVLLLDIFIAGGGGIKKMDLISKKVAQHFRSKNYYKSLSRRWGAPKLETKGQIGPGDLDLNLPLIS